MTGKMKLRIDLRTHAYNLAGIQETKLKQRSNVNRLKKGDTTKYFHAVASTRRAINFIPQLSVNLNTTDQTPHIITQTPLILQEFDKHYKHLLGTRDASAATLRTNHGRNLKDLQQIEPIMAATSSRNPQNVLT
jgi:hypothetical protein